MGSRLGIPDSLTMRSGPGGPGGLMIGIVPTMGPRREAAGVESSEPHLLLPNLRLDELLSELQGRLQAVLATRDRVHALLEAVVAVGSNLELEAMLRRIAEAAVTLVDAQYGALGV